jgi:menaquinone-9 beta-reductase
LTSSNELNGSSDGHPSQFGKKIWDVVIVGAGPAGSTAAIHLASKGHSVLLLDRDNFPRDKVCGDGLIADAIGALKRAGLYETVLSQSFTSAVGTVFSPSRIAFDVKGQYLTIKRRILDQLILNQAVACGALFRPWKVLDVKPNSDETLVLSLFNTEETVAARIVLIATGANVDLPTKLGLVRETSPSAVALRCYVRSPYQLDRLIISYDRSITPGYAWIFPLGDQEYNVGCGFTYHGKRVQGSNLRDFFQKFTASFPLAREVVGRAETITPLKGARLRCGLRGTTPKGKTNILVIGESIGATFPFTGEGIGKAMETAELASGLASEALTTSKMDCLGTYADTLERELRHRYLGYKIAENWFSNPWINDFMAKRIRRSRYLQEAISGLVNETVDPRKIFSIRGVLQSFFH